MATQQYDVSNKQFSERLYRAKTYTMSNLTVPGYKGLAPTPPTFQPTTDPYTSTVTVTAEGQLVISAVDDVATTPNPIDLTGATIERVDDSLGTNVYAAKVSSDCITIGTGSDNNKVTIKYLPFDADDTNVKVFIRIAPTGYDSMVFEIRMDSNNVAYDAVFAARSTATITFADEMWTGAFPATAGKITLDDGTV